MHYKCICVSAQHGTCKIMLIKTITKMIVSNKKNNNSNDHNDKSNHNDKNDNNNDDDNNNNNNDCNNDGKTIIYRFMITLTN